MGRGRAPNGIGHLMILHWGWDKVAAIYQMKISLKLVPKGSINNIPALVQIMAWRRTGDKPLSEPKLTQHIDAYMLH